MGPLCLGPPAPVITGIAVGLAAGELLPRWLRAVDWAVAALPCSRVPSTAVVVESGAALIKTCARPHCATCHAPAHSTNPSG